MNGRRWSFVSGATTVAAVMVSAAAFACVPVEPPLGPPSGGPPPTGPRFEGLPTEAPSGERVSGTVRGFAGSSGWQPVRLTLGTTGTGPLLWEGMPRDPGMAAVAFIVPNLAPGAYGLTATQRANDGRILAGTPVTVDFRILAGPQPAPPPTAPPSSAPASTTPSPLPPVTTSPSAPPQTAPAPPTTAVPIMPAPSSTTTAVAPPPPARPLIVQTVPTTSAPATLPPPTTRPAIATAEAPGQMVASAGTPSPGETSTAGTLAPRLSASPAAEETERSVSLASAPLAASRDTGSAARGLLVGLGLIGAATGAVWHKRRRAGMALPES